VSTIRDHLANVRAVDSAGHSSPASQPVSVRTLAQSVPTIVVTTPSGSPTSTMTFKGSGWFNTTACGGQLSVWMDDAIESTVGAWPESDGAFVTFFYPSSAPVGAFPVGGHVITARCGGFESAGSPYAVTP
jgi:hypothetical protein